MQTLQRGHISHNSAIIFNVSVHKWKPTGTPSTGLRGGENLVLSTICGVEEPFL
jgi:hypothetical protein